MNQPAARTAMVLSGGGDYGAFGVGVLKTLFAGRSPATDYSPLSPEIFTGTSVGAFNASLMAAQKCSCLDAAMHLEDVWLNRVAERAGECGNAIFRIRGNLSDLADTGCLRDPLALAARFAGDTVVLGTYALARTANFLASSNEPLEDRIMALVNIGSFVDSAPYESLLRDVIDEADIRQSSRALRVIATNWVAGKARHFSNSDFHDGRGIRAVVASTAIPGVFPPVRIDHEIYVDGGVVENTPLSAAIGAGGENLHVIYLDPKPGVTRLRGEPNTIDTMLRVYYIMLATKISEDIESARWINAGLDAVSNFREDQEVSDAALRNFTRVAGTLLQEGKRRTYKRLVIHRYFPEAALGGNLGMLDFGIDAIADMIAEGERAALLHDCKHNGCVL